MKALAQGDRSAFTPVFQALWGPTLKLCTRLVGDDGADVAQTAMLNILERAGEYDWRRPALPWAMGLAAWECQTHRTRVARRREGGEVPEVSDGGDEAAAHEQRQLETAATEALGTLSEQDRETLVDTYWARAPATGATVRKRRERALVRLRDAFRRLYGID